MVAGLDMITDTCVSFSLSEKACAHALQKDELKMVHISYIFVCMYENVYVYVYVDAYLLRLFFANLAIVDSRSQYRGTHRLVTITR